MIPDYEIAEICWAAYRKLARSPVPAWVALPPPRQDLMTEIVRAARSGVMPEQLFLLWQGRRGPRWSELPGGERSPWRAVQIVTLALSLDS